jgi:hypothetical protein
MSEMAWMHSARTVVEEYSAKWVHPYTGAILDVPDENNLPKFTISVQPIGLSLPPMA